MNRDHEGRSPGAAAPVLLYDGDCGTCAVIVRFILRRETDRSLLFAPLGGELATALRQRHPQLQELDAAVWVNDLDGPSEVLLTGSEAALAVWHYLGFPWSVLAVGARLVPRSLRQSCYRLFARYRHRLPTGAEQCTLPDQADRARFMA